MLTICHLMMVFCCMSICAHISVYSRSTLHPEGANGLKAKLHHIAALRGELMAASLEAFLIEDNDLMGKRTCS